MKADGGYARTVQNYRRLDARSISDGARKPPSDLIWAH